MDFKRFLNERIAARGEERRKAKLEEARQAQIRLLSKQKEEEIEWQVQTENKRPAPLLLNGLVAKKRKRQSKSCFWYYGAENDDYLEPENILVDHICVRNAAAEPQRSPKKPKHSSNLGASAKQDTESELARYAPASKPPRNKKNAGWREREIIDTRKKPSEWCLSTNVQNQKFNRGDRLTIPYFERLIAKCVNVIKNEGDTEQHFSELRKKLHEMEFYPFLSGVLVKKSKVLKSDGLLQIFDGHNKHVFPWDLAADAEALWMRLMSGDLDCHLMRGIEISKGVLASGKKRTSYKLEKSYTQKKSANAVGVNNLTNGQWWPYRICALRDGAHGEQEAGIYGQTGKGAYSVVVAVGGYADKDHGEVLSDTLSDDPRC
jgi:hypothetical protein